MSILNELNPMQKEAASYIDGPLLILAGAGSGKTRTLIYRIAHMIDKGIAPFNILAVTFTNKAAKEMRERISGLIGNEGDNVWISTFHSLCVRILRSSGSKIGLDNNFVIYDSGDQKQLIKNCMKELGINEKRFDPRAIKGTISNSKNELKTWKDYENEASGYYEQIVSTVYKAYQLKLEDNNGLDFDYLILKTVQLFAEDKQQLQLYQQRFKYIMVDEYQDTNKAQYILVNLLAKKHRNICVVGDDDQSIYGWRGADIKNILEFESDYPDTYTVKLEQNYRSTQNILKAAGCVIKNNSERKDKELWTDNCEGDLINYYCANDQDDESQYVLNEINRLAREGYSYKDMAILYRINSQSRTFEDRFVREQLPHTIVGGLRFYERKEIKDILAYLRFLANPHDEVSLLRIINEPRRGIGNATVEKLQAFASKNNVGLNEAIVNVRDISEITPGPSNAVAKFASLINELKSCIEGLDLTGLTKLVMDKTGYMKQLEKANKLEAELRIENLKELISVTSEFDRKHTSTEGANLLEFLEEITLVSDIDTVDNTDNCVTLMTLHSAKGLEFPIVFMVGIEENLLPHVRSLEDSIEMEEERRLCYVGITRAQERLYFTRAGIRLMYGDSHYNPESRFLKEIPEDLLCDPGNNKFDNNDHSPNSASNTKVVDISDYMKKKDNVKENKHIHNSHSSNNSRKSKGSLNTSKDSSYKPGEKVKHEEWGVGTVVAIEGKGRLGVVVVAFPTVGIKRLAIGIAPLKRV